VNRHATRGPVSARECLRDHPAGGSETGGHSEDGMVTVEHALSLFAVMIVVAFVLGVVSIAHTRIELCSAVRQGAHEAAIGGQDPALSVSQAYGRPVTVTTNKSGRWMTVTGHASVAAPAGWVGATASCTITTISELVP